MIEKNERQQDVLKLLADIDIPPYMYEKADSRYKAVANYLGQHTDLKTNMYAQGSFAFGTVVRPMKNGKDADYDLDFICEVDKERGDITASELRAIIEKALAEGKLYDGKVEYFDECITIHYAEENGVGFSIDIVPAAHESKENKDRLKKKAERPDLIDTSIAIPMGKKPMYKWHTNNPKGFQTWFEEINRPFLEMARSGHRRTLMESTDFYNTVEEIPAGMDRSAIQRVIQILKRDRDLFYKNFSDLKPISAIINVLVADVAIGCDANIGIFELLDLVLEELTESARCLKDKQNGEILLESRIVGKRNKGWYIANPANPEDNLASAWNEDSRIPDKFFLWVEVARKDLIESMEQSDGEFRAIVESAFGQDVVQKSWGDKYEAKKAAPIIGSSKPWRRE
ncbi:MAG: nucleotidyltransferase [Lachnospiraceae bacterium]|nr:nucleotidyltransferase [Lachnospiraceae bacterium]